MIRHNENMRVEMRERARGGEGILRILHMVEKDELFGKLNLCAVVDFEPGQSIGLHPHGPDAEIYFVVKGSLVVTDQGVEHTLNEGDAMYHRQWRGARR